MNELIDISEYEFDLLKRLKKNISYTPSEIDFLLEITKRFINKDARACYTCSNSIKDFKQTIYTWFNANEEKIKAQIDAQNQVINYINLNLTPE